MSATFRIVILLSLQAPLLSSILATDESPPADIRHVNLGPYENRTDDPTIDFGHRELLKIAKSSHGFKEMLGFNWTGHEIMCNCSSSFCGEQTIREILNRAGYNNTCLGTKCYHQKRFIKLRDNTWKYDEHWGCYGPETNPFEHTFASQHLFCSSTKTSNTECCSTSFCRPQVEEPHSEEYDAFMKQRKEELHAKIKKWVLICFLGALLLGLCIFVCTLRRSWKRVKLFVSRCEFRRLVGRYDEMHPEELQTMTTSDGQTPAPPPDDEPNVIEQLANDLDHSWDDSGSGSGAAQLARRDITRMIKLGDLIGSGRYGKVYVGTLQGRKVAVKISMSHDAKTHESELDAYLQNMIRHENVLEFLAHGVHDVGGMMTERWLVTAYHEMGSLFEYLHKTTVTTTQLMRLVRSMASGIAFLHTEIPGTGGKDPLAHRDIKSTNILLTPKLTCVVADLGLALRSNNGCIKVPVGVCGTVRYLAPEILDNALESESFDSYRYADIYAMSLVIWECASRTECEEGQCASPDESVPYYDTVSRDPSISEMREVVYVKGIRPKVQPFWPKNPVLEVITKIMSECWRTLPESRLTATYVRTSMERLSERLNLYREVVDPREL